MSDLSDDERLDAFSTYQAGRAFAAVTVRRRRASLNSLVRYMAPLSVRDAPVGDLETWLAGHGSPKTRHAYRSDVTAFYRWGQRRGLLEHNPAALTDPIRLPKTLPRPIPVEVLADRYG